MAKKNPQTNLFHQMRDPATPTREHGGSLAERKRKTRRPLDRKKALHVVMRASKARRHLSLRASQQRAHEINKIIERAARKFAVRIEQSGNAGNHIHLLVRFQAREGLQNFLRTVTGLIARLVTKAQRGKAAGKFWDKLIYSRVVELGRDFGFTKRYVELNEIEGAGGREARAKYADLWAQRDYWRRRRASPEARTEARTEARN